MTLGSDSAREDMAGGGISQDQTELAYGAYVFGQHWAEETTDDVEVNKLPATEVGPSTCPLGTGEKEDMILHVRNVESDVSEACGYGQWSHSHSTMQEPISHSSDARSSFGSEYNFTLEEIVDHPTHVLEADTVTNWQYSDFEDDAAGGRTYNPQDAAERLSENPPLNSGFGHPSSDLHLAATGDNAISQKHRIEANSTIEPGPWLSILNASLRLEPRHPKSMRRPNVPANRPHAQPKSHPCDRCSSAFGRAGDLRRHYRVHFPDRRTFHCRLEGCSRNGQRGFYRRDKFRDHQRHAHGVGNESELLLLEGVSSSLNL